MVAVVSAGSPVVIDFITRESECPLHLLIGHPPVAAIDIQVGAAVLKEDADRLGLILADQGRVDVAPAQADIRADRTEDPPERIGPLPRGRERADRAAAGTGDARSLPSRDSLIGRPSAVVFFSTSGSSSSSRNRT